jgi:hypothetical protein
MSYAALWSSSRFTFDFIVNLISLLRASVFDWGFLVLFAQFNSSDLYDMENSTQGTTREKKTNAEIIVDWFEGRISDDELTASQREYFNRLKACYKSILKFDARSTTLKKLCKTFDISDRTAHRIYADTEYVYGTTRKHNRDFKRLKAEEMAMRAYGIALKKGDAKAMVQAVNSYIRATGIEQDEIDIPNFQELQPGDVITLLPPQIETAITLHLNAGVVDLNDSSYIIDLPYEKVPSGDSD